MSYSNVTMTSDHSDNTKHTTTIYSSLYMIFHTIIALFALFLSWKCNQDKFNLGAFIIALLCPYLYIIWALAAHGGCGIF